MPFAIYDYYYYYYYYYYYLELDFFIQKTWAILEEHADDRHYSEAAMSMARTSRRQSDRALRQMSSATDFPLPLPLPLAGSTVASSFFSSSLAFFLAGFAVASSLLLLLLVLLLLLLLLASRRRAAASTAARRPTMVAVSSRTSSSRELGRFMVTFALGAMLPLKHSSGTER